jgi:hypothetical protein
MINNISFEKYSHKHKDRLIDLLQYMWNSLNYSEIKERFEWRYENNPYTSNPFIYISLHNENLVGFRAFVVQHFVRKNKLYKIFNPADAIVHPDYRRKGIFSELNKLFLNDINAKYPNNSIILNLSSNRYSTSGNLKQGWEKTNAMNKYAYKISISNGLSCLYRNDIKINDDIKISKNNHEFEMNNDLKIDEILQLLKNYRNCEEITNIRDSNYFKWKYSYKPEKYKYIYCRYNYELLGYMIIKYINYKKCSLEEYYVLSETLLKQMIYISMKKMNISILKTKVFNENDKYTLSKCGMIIESDMILKLSGKYRFTVLVRPTIHKAREGDFFIDGLDIRNIDNWKLYPSDIH